MNVVEVSDGMRISSGYAYLAPGDKHLSFQKGPSGLICRLLDTEPVNRHKPSVEVMFDSLREAYEGGIVSVMLTGMGSDGAHAMRRMRDAGHDCIVQDEATSVVWGMPKAAFELGVCEKTTALKGIPASIMASLKKKA
jgi:two-component system chemotaxis response regulator CheB